MKITIDGHPIQVEGRPTLLEIARQNGISIPSLCDHPQLKPFTGCRLCLVEIKGRKDYAPACGTYPDDGMEVTTVTPEIRGIRKGILELILSEHPYACLICEEKSSCEETKSTIRKVGEVTGCVLCPQNGRCDLQQAVADIGIEKVSFSSLYKNLDVRREDPFFDRDPNTCILCGKCIRVCEEIRGASVLTFISRGSQTVVGTALDRSLLESGCQFCGACVDICPTASLIERAVRPQILPESRHPIICPFCSQGCELELGTGQNRVLFSRPSESGAVNRGQSCVRGRFLIRETLDSQKRIQKPWLRKEGALVSVEWEEALEWTAARLREYGNGKTAVGISPHLPLEDAYLLMKFAREALKTDAVSTSAVTTVWARLAELMNASDLDVPLTNRFEDISSADTVLILGPDLPSSHPMAWLRIIEALENGAKLLFAGSGPSTMVRRATFHLKTKPGEEYLLAAALSREIISRGSVPDETPGFGEFRKTVQGQKSGGADAGAVKIAADLFAAAKSPVVLFDHNLARGTQGSPNLAAVWNLSLLTGSQFFPLGLASNDRGIAELERALFPERPSLPLNSLHDQIREEKISALYLAGMAFDPEAARPDFLICQDTHWSPLTKSADAVFPAAAFAEAGGTLINSEGRIQSSESCLDPPGEARPDREIIRLLAKKMGIDGFGSLEGRKISEEIASRVPRIRAAGSGDGSLPGPDGNQGIAAPTLKFIPQDPPLPPPEEEKDFPYRLSVKWSGDIYRNIDLSREIRGFGRLRPPDRVRLHPADMEKIGVKEGEGVQVLSSDGQLEGTAQTAAALPEGSAEVTLSGAETEAGRWLSKGIIPVEIRRKS